MQKEVVPIPHLSFYKSERYLSTSSNSIYKCVHLYNYTMSEEPTKEELQEKIENMEKQYDEIIEKMQERYSQRSLQIF
jgi:hypothetical protein